MNATSAKRKNNYIVLNSRGALMLCAGEFEDEPPGGVLMSSWSPTATVFDTRVKANRALQRTLGYIKKHNLSWGVNYEIIRLVSQ